MRNFGDYVHYREGHADWIPYTIPRPSSRIPTCRDHAKRLIRRFKPRITKTAPVAVQRPRMALMKWGPVR
jgi:hypothetical protein